MSIVTLALVVLIVLAVCLVATGAVNLYASEPRSRAVQVALAGAVVIVIAAVYEAVGVVWAVVLFLVALIVQLLLVLRKRGTA
jgi:hypothetical protein